QFGGQLDAGVEILNLVLDGLDEHGFLCAVVVLAVSAEAAEVRVDLAVSSAAVAEDHSEPAVAVEAALQVVRVFPGLLAGAVLSAEDVLDFLPSRRIDDRFVPSGVLEALVAHHSLVERMPEHDLDVRLLERF